nr:AmpG [Beauveria felina]
MLKSMLKLSGPIVRINPHEVHCNDRHFIEEIYALGNRKRDKPLHQVLGSGVPRAHQVDMPNYVKKAKSDVDKGLDDGTTVFASLFTSDLPASEKTLQRLTEEGFSLFAAGTETVSWALTVATYHLLTKPAMLAKLTEEVNSVVDSSGELPTWTALEKLPYLGAVIKECLRLSYGLASRTSRIPTGEDLFYSGLWTPKGSGTSTRVEYVIPRGSAIGMSAVVAHHDEEVYPDSHSFIPERWLDEQNQLRKELDRSLLSFSKGSRGCIGIK